MVMNKLNIFKVLLVSTIFVVSLQSNATNWGHLVTGTTDVLSEGQSSVGTVMVGHGVTDRLTLGISPLILFGYDLYSLISRYQIYSGERWSIGLDFWYFKSIPEQQEESMFSQENIFIKLNTEYKVTESFKLNMSYGYQVFYNEKSPYSLRPDPLGKQRTFAIKGDDPYFYKRKLESFEEEARSPETHSISIMPTYYFTNQYYINIEYGILGLFYDLPLTHIGASINSQTQKWDLSLGISKSSRNDYYGDQEVLTHSEIKVQYNF